MPKKRYNVKGYLVFLILIGAGVYSYFHSQEVYSGYMKIYYEKIRGLSIERQIGRAEELYASGEYEKAKSYLKDLVMVYPDNRSLLRLQGLTLIKLGEQSKGAESVLAASEDEELPETMLETTVQSLYEQRQYRDIVRVFRERSPRGNPNLLYYYGVSLFETGSYAMSFDFLKKAIEQGRTDYEAYHYAGRALDKKGDIRASLHYLTRAHEMNEEDHDVAVSLANAYRKLGRYDEAAKVLRKIKG